MKRDQFWTTKSLMIVILATYFALAPLVTSSASAHHETNWEGTEIDFSVPTELTPKEGVGGEFHFDYLETEAIANWRFSISKQVRHPITQHNQSTAIFTLGADDGTPPPSVYAWDGKANDGQFLTAGGVYSFYYAIQYANQGHHSVGQSGQFKVWSNYDSPTSLQPVTIIPGEFYHNQGGAFNFLYAHRAGDWQTPWTLRIMSSVGEVVYEDDRSAVDVQQYYSQLPQTFDWDGRSNIPGDNFGLPVNPGQYIIAIDMTGGFNSYSINPISTREFTISPQPEIPQPDDEGDEDEKGEVEGDIDEPEPNPEEQAEQARIAKLNPVLFIHGLNAHPSMWTEVSNNSDYVSLLKNWGYPEEYIGLYSYSGKNATGGYNNQGGVVEVSQGMRSAVMALRQASLANGGTGQVNIIAHSMGGLVARQYIKEHPSDSHIDKVIAIGTPFQGSYWLKNYSLIDNKFNYGRNDSFPSIISGLFSVNPESAATQDMIPGSKLLERLSSSQSDSVMYQLLFGSIKSEITLNIFNLVLESDATTLGDLVVSEQSASSIGAENTVMSQRFSENDPHRLMSYLFKVENGYQFRIGPPSLEDLRFMRYNHFEIYKQPEVKAAVLKGLSR